MEKIKTTQKRLTVCKREEWASGLIYSLVASGDLLVLDSSQATGGFICMKAIDSGENGFEWSRVSVDCVLPVDSAIKAYAYVCDVPQYGDFADLDCALATLDYDKPEDMQLLDDIFSDCVGHSEDFIVGKRGRYLWLKLELISTGSESPFIRSVSVRMAGDHMVDYLPAIYRENDFTKRFLSIFDSIFMDMEKRIYELPKLLDYESTHEDMLRYLASWLCIDSDSASPEHLREWISTALPDYETRYTVEGVKRSVARLSGREPLIIESVSVDPNSPDCYNPEVYRRIYGDDPFKFFVLLGEDTFKSRNDMERFLEQMQPLVPAGTQLELVLLKQCVQLDWHTYIGINSVVSSYVPVAIDENTTIHYDTMIGGSNSEEL